MDLKKILVVVDYQFDFVRGSLGFDGADKMKEGIYNRVQEYLNRGDYVIFTKDTHEEDYLQTLEGKYLPVEHCIRGTKGHEIYGEDLKRISQMENIILIEKGKFGALELLNLGIDVNEIESVELCGIDTNICVLSNAIILQNMFYKSDIIINKPLCGSYNKEMELKTFDVMKNLQMKFIEY